MELRDCVYTTRSGSFELSRTSVSSENSRNRGAVKLFSAGGDRGNSGRRDIWNFYDILIILRSDERRIAANQRLQLPSLCLAKDDNAFATRCRSLDCILAVQLRTSRIETLSVRLTRPILARRSRRLSYRRARNSPECIRDSAAWLPYSDSRFLRVN